MYHPIDKPEMTVKENAGLHTLDEVSHFKVYSILECVMSSLVCIKHIWKYY